MVQVIFLWVIHKELNSEEPVKIRSPFLLLVILDLGTLGFNMWWLLGSIGSLSTYCLLQRTLDRVTSFFFRLIYRKFGEAVFHFVPGYKI